MKEIPSDVHGRSKDEKQKEKFEAMRKRLSAYRTLNEEIDNEIERLDRMQMKATSVGSQVLSDMPKSQSSVYDRMADAVARIISLENEIKQLVYERDEERKAIEDLVRSLGKAGERAIIRSRYLDLEEWEDVQFVLFGNKADFNDRYDEYKQRMFRWHRTAIENLANISA